MSGRRPKALVQADKRADPVVDDALERGFLDSGRVYDIPRLRSHDVANEVRRSVTRSARRRNLSPACWVADEAGNPCWKACQNPGAPHMTRFRLFSKDAARGHILRETGGDPSKLKWNPWDQGKNRRYSDSGQPV